MAPPGPAIPDTESLVQPNRRFTSLETVEELEGTLEVPDRPEISAGYADIYRGVWTSAQGDRIEVAVKEFRALIPRDRQNDPEALKKRTETRMKREVFVWSQTKHPNLHPLFGYRSQPKPRLISPWCLHGNLMDYLRERPGLTRQDKIRLIYQTSCGLYHLHSQAPPICHADIKPENILINVRLEAVLSDFGLSMVLEGLGVPSGLTTSERVKGTLNYMASELFEGEKPSCESDVYAFGGLILTVMSGKPPFSGLREPIIIRRIIQDQVPKPEDHPDLPPSDFLWELMHRCWRLDPAFRPTMQEVLGKLSEERGTLAGIEVQPTARVQSKVTLTEEEKTKVKSAIPKEWGKIISAFLVKIYHAHPDPSKWTFTGQEGALALAADKIHRRFWFKMVDLKGAGGVTWEHQLDDDFAYHQDQATFHSLAGDSFMIGFSFFEEQDANTFLKKVNGRAKSKTFKDQDGFSAASLKGRARKIKKADITALGSFQHVSHMGWSEETGFSSQGVDESWASLVGRLKTFGISEENVMGNEAFIQELLENARAENVDAANRSDGASGAGDGTSKSIVPGSPSPAASTATKRKPPSPPVRGNGPAASINPRRSRFDTAQAQGVDSANRAHGATGTGEGASKSVVPVRPPPPAAPAVANRNPKLPSLPSRRNGPVAPKDPASAPPALPSRVRQPNGPVAAMESPGPPLPPQLPPRRTLQPPASASTQVKQVAPMGQTEETSSSARDPDESLAPLLGQLERFGISEKVVRRNEEFVRKFVEKANADGLDAANRTFGVPDKR